MGSSGTTALKGTHLYGLPSMSFSVTYVSASPSVSVKTIFCLPAGTMRANLFWLSPEQTNASPFPILHRRTPSHPPASAGSAAKSPGPVTVSDSAADAASAERSAPSSSTNQEPFVLFAVTPPDVASLAKVAKLFVAVSLAILTVMADAASVGLLQPLYSPVVSAASVTVNCFVSA